MRYYEYQGKKYTQTQLARMAGLSIGGLRKRLKKGWAIEKILTTPPYKEVGSAPLPDVDAIPVAKTYEYNGQTYNLTQLAKIANLSIGGVRRRLKNGCSIEEVVNTPSRRGEGAIMYLTHTCQFKGKTIGVNELAKQSGFTKASIYARIYNGMTLQEIADKIEEGKLRHRQY